MNFDKLNYDSDIIYNNRLDAAMEATSIAHQMKEEYTLRDNYFPYVESFLPKTEHVLFKHIAKYDDKNSYNSKLYSINIYVWAIYLQWSKK